MKEVAVNCSIMREGIERQMCLAFNNWLDLIAYSDYSSFTIINSQIINFTFRMKFLLSLTLLIGTTLTTVHSDWVACSELSPVLRLPCRCRVEQIAVNGQSSSIGLDCDRVVFSSETLQIPKGAPISTFSHRHSGQSLPTPVRHFFLMEINLIFFLCRA